MAGPPPGVPPPVPERRADHDSVRRRSICLLLLLPLPAAAEGEEERLAREVVEAHARGDQGRIQILAAEPASRVSYPRVVDGLLRVGHVAEAEALARERQGPEADGLLRIVQSFKDGKFPTAQEEATLRQAVGRIAGAPAAALADLETLRPREGTVFAVDVSRAKVAALKALGRNDEMRAELPRLAALALAVGDWRIVCAAEEARLEHATSLGEGLTAAESFLDAARRIDDREKVIKALRARGRMAAAAGTQLRNEGDDDGARARWKQAREDFVAAAEAAERAGDPHTVGLCWSDIAVIVQDLEGQPGQALKAHERALEPLRAAGTAAEVDATLFRMARALTDLTRYDEALARLDEVLTAARTPALRPKALAQRAYVLGRAARLQSALAAYNQALDAAEGTADRASLLVQTGDLHLARRDPAAAERCYADTLAIVPDDAGALVGKARALGLRGDVQGARGAYEAALERLEGAQRGIVLGLLAEQLMAFGRAGDAVSIASEEVKILVDVKLREFGNAGAAWKTLADATMLDGDHKQAAKYLANAATIFYRLNDPSRAIDLYAQETLLSLMLGNMRGATERLQVMAKMAETTPSDALKSVAKSAEAIYRAKAGQRAEALQVLDEAQRLAKAANDPAREATALVNRALLDPDTAAGHVRRALEILDQERLAGPSVRPLIEGFSPEWGPGIGLDGILKSGKDLPEDALLFLERALGRQNLLAFGGRDAILAAGLTEEQHALYVTARSDLVEARATGKGVAEAEAAFDAMVGRLRADAPAIADLAWPPDPPLGDVREAVRNGEALVIALFDPYASCALFVDRQKTALLRVESPAKLFDGLAKLLDGKHTVILACGGAAEAVPATARYRVCHVPSASAFLRLRTAKLPRGEGIAALGTAPERFGPPLEDLPGRRLSMLYVGKELVPLQVLGGRFDADTVVVESPSALPTTAAALLATGARNVVVAGRSPGPIDIFLDGCLDRKIPVASAFREASAKGPLFFYGPPE